MTTVETRSNTPHSTTIELIAKIREAGGQVWLQGSAVHYRLPRKQKRLLAELRANKTTVLQILREQEPKICIPIACRCSARRYAHVHPPEDQRLAIAAWNSHSRHKIDPIHCVLSYPYGQTHG